MVFAYHLRDAERSGVVAFDATGKVGILCEKPFAPKNQYATGLYFCDEQVVKMVTSIKQNA